MRWSFSFLLSWETIKKGGTADIKPRPLKGTGFFLIAKAKRG
jgi:hypothetical protein